MSRKKIKQVPETDTASPAVSSVSSTASETGTPESLIQTAPPDGQTVPEKPRQVKPEQDSRETLEGFRGGVRINLKREVSPGISLEVELGKHVGEILDQEIKNHAQLVKNIRRSERQYMGKKKNKVFPWYGASSLAIPETRKNVDTAFVRYTDAIFNRRKVVILKALKPELAEDVRKMEDALDWFLRHVIRFKDKLLGPLFQALISGTGILHISWAVLKETVYRYATDQEKIDPSVKKYVADGGVKLVKEVQTSYEGPQLFPVSREDFIISSDADNIKDALLTGFRKYYRRAEVEVKEAQGLFRKGTCDRLAYGPDKFDEVKESRSEIQGKELVPPKYADPYEVWTLWTKYDVDGDGEEDSIIISYHRESGTILDAIYNPVFTSTRPFVKIVGQPLPFSFDGQGLCDQTYHLQEAIDTIANQRIDRGTLCNTVSVLTRADAGADLKNFKFQPGKNFVVEEGSLDEVFRPIEFPPIPPSAFTEEAGLKQDIRELCGNSPENMGFSSADRPVFKDTMARLEEGNKRRKSFIDFVRDGVTECIYQIFELWSQYQPVLNYRKEDAEGKWAEQTVSIPANAIRESIGIELAAATEVLSQDMRREVEQNAFMLVRQYQTDIGGICQLLVNPEVPQAMKKVLMAGAAIGSKLMVQILRDFDLPDAESLVLDVNKILQPQDINQPPKPPQPQDKMNEAINYKDAPDEIKRQMEAKYGYKPAFGAVSDGQSNSGAETGAPTRGIPGQPMPMMGNG